MKLCAVIPARDEEATVAEVVRGALEHCEEVVVIDDASRDGTARAAEEAGAVVVRLFGGTVSAMISGHEVAKKILRGWVHQAREGTHAG